MVTLRVGIVPIATTIKYNPRQSGWQGVCVISQSLQGWLASTLAKENVLHRWPTGFLLNSRLSVTWARLATYGIGITRVFRHVHFLDFHRDGCPGYGEYTSTLATQKILDDLTLNVYNASKNKLGR